MFYVQTDGVVMCFPLSPVVANLFMESFENSALERATLKLLYFKRFVDDVFIVWPHGQERLLEFLDFLSGFHLKIKFTMEVEIQGMLLFLDVLVYWKADGAVGYFL